MSPSMKNKLSIITVCFNAQEYIGDTIVSIRNQTIRPYEYIIVDGGSTDKTNEIIDRYKAQLNGNLTHISEPDNGIYDAMNKGIALGKGKIIGLLNSDDYYFENTLATVYESYLKTDKNVVLTGNMIFKSKDGEQLLKNNYKMWEIFLF